MRYCFGVDVGGTTTKMGIFLEDGSMVEKWEIKTHTENEGCRILPDIAASIRDKSAERSLSREDCAGVGIAIPAPVTEEGNVKMTANIGWKKEKAVKREMEELTSYPVFVGNDANAAALGEMWKGAGQGRKNMVMITLGTGVGGGVIAGGRILVGGNGGGGEIGHICINPEETQSCGCGKRGCLEQYASATGLVRLGREQLSEEKRVTCLKEGELTAKAIFDALKDKDPVAEDIVKRFSQYLARGLAILGAIADPTVFVIGGGVSKAGNILLEYLREPYEERAVFASKNAEFILATLGNDAGIYGAAKMVLDGIH
ncbi:MAG: ROK family glucokinase [Lachnospiraceae bacterium]|nr:ROK family glucokinase [Lachnospiraceae bacterium]